MCCPQLYVVQISCYWNLVINLLAFQGWSLEKETKAAVVMRKREAMEGEEPNNRSRQRELLHSGVSFLGGLLILIGAGSVVVNPNHHDRAWNILSPPNFLSPMLAVKCLLTRVGSASLLPSVFLLRPFLKGVVFHPAGVELFSLRWNVSRVSFCFSGCLQR